MNVLNIKIKQDDGKEEYCLLLPTLSSSSIINILRSILSAVVSTVSTEHTIKDFLVHNLGLNNIVWEPPRSVYRNKAISITKPDLSGDIPLQLFDKVMKTLEKSPEVEVLEQLEENSPLVVHNFKSIDEPTKLAGFKSSVNKESESKISKVDIYDYDLPKASDVVCSVCGKTFLNAVNLRRHFLNHSIIKEKPHYCRTCDEWIRDATTFKNHQNQHQNRCCKTCKVEFSTVSEKENHDCQHPFKCETCKKIFRRKQQLEAHKLVHSGLKQYGCEHCGKLFKQMGHLKAHVEEVHEVDKSSNEHVCNECGKGFPSQRKLNYHMTYTHSHKKLKRHTCPICGKDFSRAKLKPHIMRVHENNFPFSCQYCAKSFVSKYYVERHVSQSHRSNL